MTDLATIDAGTGRPLLWGHGLGVSMREEDRRGPIRWAAEDHDGIRVLRWDARGHGTSPDVTHSEQAQWHNLAADALAVADHHGIDTFVAGGASMGAATAIHTALAAPERVEGLVLTMPPNAWSRREISRVLYRGISAVTSLPIPLVGNRNRSSVFHGAAHSDLPWPRDLAVIECPVTIMTWRFDPLHPIVVAEQLAEILPQATLHVNNRFGDTRGWADEIRRFVTSLD